MRRRASTDNLDEISTIEMESQEGLVNDEKMTIKILRSIPL
jgi:hypothetical protein